jgi:MFS family permease
VRAARRRLPANVRTLGWVSLANDSASELAYPILPLFLVLVLGAPLFAVALVEGVPEAISTVVKLFSGWASDRMGNRRRGWITAGYALSAFARVVIAGAGTWRVVLAGRVVDRVGKGTRGTPRDAMIRDSSPPGLVGASFGYHRAMDTAGAVVGPLLAVVLLESGVSLRSILWVAVLPAAAALLLLPRLRESARAGAPVTATPQRVSVRGLPDGYWRAVGIWTVFCLGNSSDLFLLLRAHGLGLAPVYVVLAYAVYNLVYSGSSWPLGSLSDRVPRQLVLGGGLAVFALVYLGFAAAPGAWVVWPLFALYGLYIAATDGVAKAWVADELRGRDGIGTAFGVFQLLSAAAALLASLAAAYLWVRVEPGAAFALGAVSAGLALVLLCFPARRQLRVLAAAGCVVAFAGAAWLVAAGSFSTLDERAVSRWMPHGAWRTAADVLDAPAGLPASSLVALALVAVLWRRGARGPAARWAVAFTAGSVVAAAAGALLARPGLYTASFDRVSLAGSFTHSFPGGDAVRVVLLAALAAAVAPRLRALAALWAAATLAVLVPAGLHTPSDVLGAVLLGGGLAALAAWRSA